MYTVLDGIYENGSIKLKTNPHLKEKSNLKILIVHQENNKNDNTKFGLYNFPINLDEVNIREYAHED